MTVPTVVDAYFDAWRAGDPSALAPLLAEDVLVHGPLGRIEGAANYQQALSWIFGITRELDMIKQWADGPDIISWFHMHHPAADEPIPAVNWLHVENDLITRVRVAFDPRPILPLTQGGQD